MHDDAFFHKRKRRKRFAISFVFVFVIFAVIAGLIGLAVVDGVQRGGVVRSEISAAQATVANRDFVSATTHLKKASDELETINLRLQALRFLKPFPWIGPQIEALLLLAKDGKASLDVITTLAEIGIDIEVDLHTVEGFEGGLASFDTYAELTPEARMELVFALYRAVPDLEEARARLRQQRRDLERVDPDDLFIGLRFARDELLEQIRLVDNSLQLMVPLLSILPEVAGFEGTQNYLLFLQNTGELRPTGGFWGTYGVLTLKDGEIMDIQTDDIYAVDAPSVGHIRREPPAPIKRYLGLDNWYLRDANWSPDVPTAIRQAISFYKDEISVPSTEEYPVTAPNVEFDGAILITPEVAVSLLELFGNVQIGDVEFTPDNFFDVLEYEVEQAFIERGIPVTQRKDIIGKLVDVLFARFKQADGELLSSLLESTLNLLDNNDILAYSAEPTVQQVFERQGWSGDLRVHAKHDHLMVVDANLGALKTDSVISRAYTYSVHRDVNGDLIAAAQVNYDHLGGFDYRTTRYRTYTRVYVPLGSELIGVNGSLLDDQTNNPNGTVGPVDVTEEFGATVFGTFTAVEPGSTGSLEFIYKLPARITEMVEAGKYELHVQRQPGISRAALNLDLDFDETIKGAMPEEISEYWYDDSYTYTTKAAPFQTYVVEF
ncbi:MAG TPA: DUF4012 domain-containing protein [Patescibacteria group bacterium]|nr:DUF4012 domain-containing protein [Patescibacteria group bacterium]